MSNDLIEESPQLFLEYGDIIKIYASNNHELHQNTYFIKYINNKKIELVNTSSLYPYIIYFKEGDIGELSDESIEKIEIIWKSAKKGYIAQNGLEIHKWIDIHFSGDFPVIFTGEITDILEDQMEVTLYPSLDVIYIDFEYKGLPMDKHIEKIVLRLKPNYVENIKKTKGDENEKNLNNEILDNEILDSSATSNASIEFTDSNESVIKIPDNFIVDKDIRQTLHNLYINANDIIFDTGEVEYVNQIVEIDQNKKIYGLDEQITNLLDEMLSTIPNNARTRSVMENIERIINHFKYLRKEFSKIDQYENIISPLILGVKHKPLVDKIQSLSTNLKWIIPVVSLNKNIYLEKKDDDEDDAENNIDSITSSLEENLKGLQNIQDDYFKDTNNQGAVAKYPNLIQTTEKEQKPYSTIEPTPRSIIINSEVNSNIESIIDNLDEFKTIVYKRSSINTQKYVIQKYNLGTSLNWIEGKKKHTRTILTHNEKIQIKSIMFLPEQIVRFSKIDLPNTNILQRSTYSQKYPLLYRIFNKSIDTKIDNIDINNNVFNYEKNEKDTNIKFLSNFKNFTIERKDIISEDYTNENENQNQNQNNESKNYNDFLEKIVPSTYDLVSLLQKYMHLNNINGYSFLDMVNTLEPFSIYSRNISYNVYIRIQYFIKESIKKWKNNQILKGREYRLIRDKTWNKITDNKYIHPLITLFKEKSELQTLYFSIYNDIYKKLIIHNDGKHKVDNEGGIIKNEHILSPQETSIQTSEILQKIMSIDSGKSITLLLHTMLISLTIPDSIINSIDKVNMENINNEMTADEIDKIKPDGCTRRFLTKIYKSLKELQDDNHKEIYYDKDIDNTPYDLLTKELKTKKEQMTVNQFEEFFTEILVHKHSIPRAIANEFAINIINGKKLVKEGEYAILETYPTDLELMNETTVIKTYYVRSKNIWKRDDTIENMDAFIDNNTLFCNLSNINNLSCIKRSKTTICQETNDARKELLQKTRDSLFKEFDLRTQESINKMKENLENDIRNQVRLCKKMERMAQILLYKENKYAFDLGSILKSDIQNYQYSKWENLLEKILSQIDFIKKQKDILIFADKFTREPLIEALNESPYWLYCRETNLKLLPIYIYELAKTYISGGIDEYSNKMKEIVRKYGTMSEDGDSIVDGLCGSGRVIKKIDFVEEEEYDDMGFKINHNSVIKKDLEESIKEVIGFTKNTITQKIKQPRIFENETNEVIYNILTTLCKNIGIPSEGIEDDIIRISNETINVIVVNEKKYLEKTKNNDKVKPYIQYRNQNIILIVAFVLLISIQTAIPSFRPENSVPGCVLSFDGYPFDGGEQGNTEGLKYISCVLNISKSSIGVWAAIKGIKDPVNVFMKTMKDIIAKHVLPRSDVISLFNKKREYLLLNKNIDNNPLIPTQQNIQKWKRFTPPIINYKINETLTPLPTNFFQDFRKSLINANKFQWSEIGIVRTKIIQYTYGIIEHINNIVKRNDPVLNTVSLIPFLQNACCNDRGNIKLQNTLEYFAINEGDIAKYIVIIKKMSESMDLNELLSLASTFIHTLNTTRKSTIIPKNDHTTENIYQSFIHYGKFDNDAPIPEFLRPIIQNKPPTSYNSQWSILEKIKYLKENGKKYDRDDLNNLIISVNSHNSIEQTDNMISPNIPNAEAMGEYINHLDNIDSNIIEEPLKKHLRAVINNYKINTISLKDTQETIILKNYLIRSNKEMMNSIFKFMDEYRGGIDGNRIDKAKIFIKNFSIWDDDTDERITTMTQYTKNVVCDLTTTFPSIILNSKPILKTVPPHWDLSVYHEGDVEKFIESYYIPIMKFIGDGSIVGLLNAATESLIELVKFINYIPIIQPLRKINPESNNEEIFNSIFDKDTIYLLFTYIFYSVLYEYIQKSLDTDILKIDMIQLRNEKRININNNNDITNTIIGINQNKVDEEFQTEIDRLNEIQIQIGSIENIKKKTVELLVAFLSIEEETKKSINKSYNKISEQVNRSKLVEKKTITDYFKHMTNDARKVEYTLKVLKLGRWNLGMQKGVFEYDKDVYDKEHIDILGLLEKDQGIDDYVIETNNMVKGVKELERDEQNMANEEYDIEELGIQHLEDDYMDGNYYGNDENGDYGDDEDFNYD